MPVSKSRARPRRTQRKGFWPDVCAPGAQSRRHAARATAFSFAGPAGGCSLRQRGGRSPVAPSKSGRGDKVTSQYQERARHKSQGCRTARGRARSLRGRVPFCAWPACPGLPTLMHQRLSGVCPQPSSSAGLRWERPSRTHCVSNSFLHDPTPCASARCGYVPGNGIQRFSFLSLRAPKRGGAPRVPPFRPCDTATLGGVPQISPSLRRVPPRHVEAACRLLNFGHMTCFPGKSLKPPWPELCHYPRGGRSPA